MRPVSLSSGMIGSMLTAASLFPSSISVCRVAQQCRVTVSCCWKSYGTVYKPYIYRDSPLQFELNISLMWHEQVSDHLWFHHFFNISMTLWVLFFPVWGFKIAILFCGMAVKSYILWCSRGYCAVPTFLRVFPVSAPCLSSSFKSIYCSQKSIRLSEERCRIWGYGSVLFHFIPLILIHTHTGKKNCNANSNGVSVFFFSSFFFWVVTVRKKCHTSLEKTKGKLSLFPGQPDQCMQALTSLAWHTESIFMLDQIASLSVTTPYSDKALSSPGLTS